MAFESLAFADEYVDGEGDQQFVEPFGASDGFMMEFPAVYAEDSGSIFPTLTDGNDRTGDKD